MVDGRLEPEPAITAERHLEDCRACRDAFAALSAQDESLGRALEHDPGDAYFESFSERVTQKIAEGGKFAPVAGSPFERFTDWFSVPQNLAVAGAVGAVVIGVGTALIVAQQSAHRVAENDKLVARMEERGGAAAPPPTALNQPLSEHERHQRDLDASAEPGATLGLSEEAARQAQEFRKGRDDGAAKAVEVKRNALGDDEAARRTAPLASAPSAGLEGSDNAKSALRAQPLAVRGGSRENAFEGGTVQLCGEVVDVSGRPLRFANVVLVNRGANDQTDDHGRFCLTTTPGRDSLVVQLLGFSQLRSAVSVGSSPSDVRLTLKPVLGLTRSSRQRTEPVATSAPRAEHAEVSFSALPETLQKVADLAQRLSTVAARSHDARQYEAAALQWRRVLESVVGTPLEVSARGRMAEMLYHAWDAEPDHRRAQAAREALTAYLVRAPIGPERNRATLWLDKVAQ